MKKPNLSWFNTAVILVITFASFIGLNQYHYGMWNQFIALPWLYDLMDPSLYPHDPLIAQRESSPSFYNYLLKGLAPAFNGNIAVLHFVLFILVHLLTFVSFFRLSRFFFDDKRAAFMGLIALSVSFPSIGYVAVLDTVLMERTIALPLLLFSLVFILRKNWLPAVLLQALAFNIHPLSSAHFICFSWLGILFAEGFKWSYLRYWPLLIILMLPVLYLKWIHPSDASALSVTPEWMEIMYIRNFKHAFPSKFELLRTSRAALIAVVYFIVVARGGFEPRIRRFLYGFAIGVLFFIALGTVFTEIYPLRIMIQLQSFRSFKFLVTLTLILWSGLLFKKDNRLFLWLAIPVLLQYYYGIWSKSIGVTIILVISYLLLRRDGEFKRLSVGICASLVLLLGITGYFVRDEFKFHEGTQDEDWYDIQRYIRENTAQDAVVIVPPSELGFRVKSLRTSYGDWYDGTKAFFSEEYGELWWNRMNKLQCSNPGSLKEDFRLNNGETFKHIWRELEPLHSEGYVITFHDMVLEDLTLTYENDDYRLYQLNPRSP